MAAMQSVLGFPTTVAALDEASIRRIFTNTFETLRIAIQAYRTFGSSSAPSPGRLVDSQDFITTEFGNSTNGSCPYDEAEEIYFRTGIVWLGVIQPRPIAPSHASEQRPAWS
jgi:hypothetical protein